MCKFEESIKKMGSQLKESDSERLKNLGLCVGEEARKSFDLGTVTEKFVEDYDSAIDLGKKWALVVE